MARCLVTGHKGYIGSKLFQKLKDLGHEVMGIDLNGKLQFTSETCKHNKPLLIIISILSIQLITLVLNVVVSQIPFLKFEYLSKQINNF